jgi:chromosome segregation ATPase
MTTPRDELQPAPREEGSAVPFRVLGRAARSAASAASEAVATDDDAVALAALAELDQALAELAQLVTVVPALIAASFPGGAVQREIADRAARLKDATASVAAQRAALDQLKAVGADLSETVAAYQDLREQAARLRRLERLAGALTELASQQKVIDDRVAVLTESAGADESRFAAGCADLLRLTTERLQILEPRTRELAEHAGAEQARLAAVEAEASAKQAALARSAERLAELRLLCDSSAAALREHAEADREVLRVLSQLPDSVGDGSDADGLDVTRQVLADVQSDLMSADDKLKRVLEARELTPVTGP